MNRTSIGELLRAGRDADAAAALLEAIEIADGNLMRASCILGFTDRHLRNYLWRLDLWDSVDTIRRERYIRIRRRLLGPDA